MCFSELQKVWIFLISLFSAENKNPQETVTIHRNLFSDRVQEKNSFSRYAISYAPITKVYRVYRMEIPWNSVSSPFRTIFTPLLTKPYLAWGGGQVDPPVVFFNNWKGILSRQLKFSGCLNPYFAYTRLNLYFNLLSVIGFQHCIALWKAYIKSKQIAQRFAQIFAQTSLKRICTFQFFLNTHLGFNDFANIFAHFYLLGLFKNV